MVKNTALWQQMAWCQVAPGHLPPQCCHELNDKSWPLWHSHYMIIIYHHCHVVNGLIVHRKEMMGKVTSGLMHWCLDKVDDIRLKMWFSNSLERIDFDHGEISTLPNSSGRTLTFILLDLFDEIEKKMFSFCNIRDAQIVEILLCGRKGNLSHIVNTYCCWCPGDARNQAICTKF